MNIENHKKIFYMFSENAAEEKKFTMKVLANHGKNLKWACLPYTT